MSLWWKADPAADCRPARATPEIRATPETFAQYAPFFLGRLSRLSALRASPRLTALERRLVDHALYSTYWDCVGVDARDEALVILDDAKRSADQSEHMPR